LKSSALQYETFACGILHHRPPTTATFEIPPSSPLVTCCRKRTSVLPPLPHVQVGRFTLDVFPLPVIVILAVSSAPSSSCVPLSSLIDYFSTASVYALFILRPTYHFSFLHRCLAVSTKLTLSFPLPIGSPNKTCCESAFPPVQFRRPLVSFLFFTDFQKGFFISLLTFSSSTLCPV